MLLLMNVIILCGLLCLMAYFGTGTDEKNIKSFSSYPKKVQERIRKNPKFEGKIHETSVWAGVISNFVLWSVLFFLLGLYIRTESFWMNFLYLTVMGQVMNIFDLVVLDMLWWRNSKRPRISGTEDMKKEYQDVTPHVNAFLRAIPMFLAVALLDGFLLTLF